MPSVHTLNTNTTEKRICTDSSNTITVLRRSLWDDREQNTMQMITVGAATLNQTPLDWSGNLQNIITAVRVARDAGVTVLCCPEMSLSGYGCEDTFLSPSLREQALSCLFALCDECTDIAVAIGLPIHHNNLLYDGVAFIANGQIEGVVAKQFLAGDGIHYEPRWFTPWPAGEIDHIVLKDRTVPFGDLIFEVTDVRIGFEICEDAWAAERPGIRHARCGVDLILNPSASHFSFGKHETRKSFVIDGSRAFCATYVYANLVGNEAGRIIYDGGAMIASGGHLVAESPRFSFHPVHVLTAHVDIDNTRMIRSQKPHQQTPRNARQSIVCPMRFKTQEAYPTTPVIPTVSPLSREEEFACAVSLGLFDYMRKSRSRGFVVSLSGGADSGAVALLVRIMVERLLQDIGFEALCERLPDISFGSSEPENITGTLLTCVYQSTCNSGNITRSAAKTLADDIGARYLEWDVDALVTAYTHMVEISLERTLTWDSDDIALQNIQARVRSPGVWMLANVLGALLLSTSNRSEAAVGYATMDGDTSGGLAPIAGIDKAWLLIWLRHMELHGLPGTGPFPALSAITRQQPTAELRPNNRHQTDEADLMPYPILNRIEKLAILERKSPLDVCRVLYCETGEASGQIRQWVSRFFTLFSHNQWKRERYAPSFHLDDQNLDPRSWCRFPILSGGFRTELLALNDWDPNQSND